MPVPPENLLGGVEGQGFAQMMRQLPQERLVIGCGAVGAMEGALERTIAYARERQAFGGPLMQFQNTRFKLAECAANTMAARAFNDACIAAHLKGELTAETAAMNKFWLSDMQGRVIDECLQLFGGYGYMMRVSRRRDVDGRPGAAHLRGDERDHEGDHRARADGAAPALRRTRAIHGRIHAALLRPVGQLLQGRR